MQLIRQGNGGDWLLPCEGATARRWQLAYERFALILESLCSEHLAVTVYTRASLPRYRATSRLHGYAPPHALRTMPRQRSMLDHQCHVAPAPSAISCPTTSATLMPSHTELVRKGRTPDTA